MARNSKRKISKKEIRFIIITFLSTLGFFSLMTIFTEMIVLTLVGWGIVAVVSLGIVAMYTKRYQRR